ncbi:MAG TPA: GMC family oxidoreductase [Candidatus Binataceae bacterium]|nr:GMC family oxidoreductase [Candidatus Binataceae bacterium]
MNSPGGFDAIIIGSGAGGAAAAYELAGAGWSVLVLEKGRRLPLDGSTLDIQQVVHGGRFLSQEPWSDSEGRALIPEEHFNVGGKTCWYGAALLRFAPHEFAPDPIYECPGWPITYDDLAPYYERVEQLLDVRTFATEPALGRIVDRIRARDPRWQTLPMPMGLSAGIRANAFEATHFDGFASVAGLKHDANTAFLDRVAGLPNFRLEEGAEVAELLMADPTKRQVTGVRLTDGRVFEGARLFLAAGALHSPRLLQRLIERHGLAARLPAAAEVGRRLKLHLLTALIAVSPGKKHDQLRKTALLSHPNYPHSSAQPLGFDGELIGTLLPGFVPHPLATAIGSRAYGFFLLTEDGSARDNQIREAVAAHGVDRVFDYRETRTPYAAREHRDFVRSFQRALLHAGMVSFTQRIGLKGTAHACGTLSTGNDPTQSVVDSDGRVHGFEALYVVDGSVLPRSSRVNPSLTIFAWSLRVADRLVDL